MQQRLSASRSPRCTIKATRGLGGSFEHKAINVMVESWSGRRLWSTREEGNEVRSERSEKLMK